MPIFHLFQSSHSRILWLPFIVASAFFVSLDIDSNGTLFAQDKVAAYVGEEPIMVSRLNVLVKRVLTRTEATGERLKIVQAQVLEENVKQRLVNQFLKSSNYSAAASEIDLQLSTLKKELQAKKSDIEKYLEKRQISMDQLKESIAWELSWGKYLDSFLTESNLEKYFQKHRKRLDGTQLRVAHVLIKPEEMGDVDSWKEAYEKAKSISKSIAAEKLTFEQAVIQHSSGATKINKGELGWIGAKGPMAVPFTAAAFQLKAGEVSQPVQTTFGFHLIKLLEVKPGTVTLNDIRGDLVPEVKRYLYDWLASKQLKQTKVRFTGEFPYFEPGTKKFGKLK